MTLFSADATAAGPLSYEYDVRIAELERRGQLRSALLAAANTAETPDGWPSWVHELADTLHVPLR